jgi:hypothetical protein
MNIEAQHQNLIRDLSELLRHWHRLADHAKQPTLPRKVINDRCKELETVIQKNA